MAKIIIIGAGLTGLSAAYHLEKKGFTDYLIVEKESNPGGLCRSLKQDGFTFDFTGHLLHSTDPYFDSFICELMGDENLHTLIRRSFIYSHNVYTPYPYQINLHGLPVDTIVDCIEGFANRRSALKGQKSFSAWVLKFFGQGLGRSFFFPYQRKLLQFDPKNLSTGWTGRFVPKTSLRQMLYGALQKKSKTKDDTIGYNATFLYPRIGGIQYLIDQLVLKIKKPIITRCAVTKIDIAKKIVIFDDGSHKSYDFIINTMPLDQLLCIIHDRTITNFSRISRRLLCTGVACLNIGISRSLGLEKQWIYYPEKQYPFYRIGFYHTFSPALVPTGCSSLYIECSYRNESERAVQSRINAARKKVKKLFTFTENDIVTENILYMPHGYVIYDFWRERNVPRLLLRLEQEGIYSIGRYGSWKYASMQEAVLDGKHVVEKIIIQPAQRILILKETERSYLRKKYKKKELQS